MDQSQVLPEEPHLLNLKVMRLSAPSLARHSTTFFLDPDPTLEGGEHDILNTFRSALAKKDLLTVSSIGSLETHNQSTSASASTSSYTPMRDLPISPLLLLPSSFGTISLGETFTAALCLSNDSPYPVLAPRIQAEMQSNTQKIKIGERGARFKEGSGAGLGDGGGTGKNTIGTGETLEMRVSSEMRELGMNVLVVTVTYESSTGLREFVKYYKFAVTAPLAIKTKVHLPTSPSSLLSPSEREKIYLEVHIQNVSPGNLVFEKVDLQTVPGMEWLRDGVQEAQSLPGKENEVQAKALDIIKRGALSQESLAPGTSRQILFILRPTPRPPFPSSSIFPPSHIISSVLPLGRLDLNWRSAYGEKGHLLTAMLNRRAPGVGIFGSTIKVASVSGVQGGQGAQQPQQSRILDAQRLAPPGSPSPAGRIDLAPAPPPKFGPSVEPTLELDLTVLECNRKAATMFESLTMKLRLVVGEVGSRQPGEKVLHLAIQYLMEQQAEDADQLGRIGSTRLGDLSGTSTPLMLTRRGSAVEIKAPPNGNAISRPGTPKGYSLGVPPTIQRTPSRGDPSSQDPYEEIPAPKFPPPPIPNLSSPFSENAIHGKVGQLGPSLIVLPSITLQPLVRPSSNRDESPRSSIDGERVLPPPPPAADRRKEGVVDFDLKVMPEREGLAMAGGLRVLMMNDPEDWSRGGSVLAEWPTLGEIYVVG